MSQHRRRGRAIHSAAIAAAVVLMSLLLTTMPRPELTMASFTDTATVTSGTFSMAQGQTEYCKVVKDVNGIPVEQAGMTCSVKNVDCSNSWVTNGNMYVNAYIYFTSSNINMSDASLYPLFGVNLANHGCAPPASGATAWSWTKAATLASGQVTPIAGYQCASLPFLQARSPLWVLNSGSNAYFQMVSDRTAPVSGTISCGV